MIEDFNESMLTKSLLVIGNGFDLSCDLHSNYKDFLESILDKKTDFGKDKVFDEIKKGLKEYLRDVNFFYDPENKVNGKIDQKYKIIQDLNVWYIIFLYKNMIHNSEWYLVENQIFDELLEDKNSLNIIEKIGDTLLSIYTESRTDSTRLPQYCSNKEKNHESYELIDRIYKFLAYSLLNKNLNKLNSEDSKNVFKELRNKVKNLNKEYHDIDNLDLELKEMQKVNFEKKISSELFLYVAKTLLAELNELELDFKNYLIECINSTEGSYTKVAESYIYNILNSIYCDRYSCDINSRFNILSFNYTTPWKDSSEDKRIKYFFKSVNIHGELFNDDGIIFGVDDKKLLPTQNEYIFTKLSRTLDLNTKSKSRITFTELLSSNIENVVFYGHSLSIADNGYFKMIFDKYVEKENAIFYFVYKVYSGTSKEKERKKLIKGIGELFGEYSIDKENNTDTFKKLIQNQRIKIIELDSIKCNVEK